MATYKFDTTHSSADFSARHMMISIVRGSFKNVTGTLQYDPKNPAASSVEATINTDQFTGTGLEQRDNHLKSPDFLDIAKFPTITFKSTKVEANGDGTQAKITGDLTIRDVTKQVTFEAELLGQGKNFQGEEVLGFSGHTKINREDWGLTWNMALETGGWLVGKEITVNLEIEAVKVAETEAVTA
jgi:polyisoprenoid-binding protein YceI